MKFVNEVSETMKVALSAMIYNTCGEDEQTLEGAQIKKIGPDIFHVTYALDNQFDAMDFQVAIDVVKDTMGKTDHFHYTIFRSVYGDNDEFNIEFK